jgi:hypothetical protein
VARRAAERSIREAGPARACGDLRKKLAKAGFLFLKNPQDFPLSEHEEWRFIRQHIAEETGWTLAAVDDMTMQDYIDWQAYREARRKATPAPKTPTAPRSRGRRGKRR